MIDNPTAERVIDNITAAGFIVEQFMNSGKRLTFNLSSSITNEEEMLLKEQIVNSLL